MLATSTHDNKRSEDVRTRISILSEIPERWAEVLHHWSKLNAAAWQNHAPDRHGEYLLYQTLIGAWPIDRERCQQYMLKACREAKINTSWHEPNIGYEESIRGFVDGIFQTPEFIASLERFVDPLILPGRINSLGQTLIKLVAPGVPDFYQGTELWDLSLGRSGQSAPGRFWRALGAVAPRTNDHRCRGADRVGLRVAKNVDDGAPAGDSARSSGRFFRSEQVSTAGGTGRPLGPLACLSARRKSHWRGAALYHDAGRRVGRYPPAATRRHMAQLLDGRRTAAGGRSGCTIQCVSGGAVDPGGHA